MIPEMKLYIDGQWVPGASGQFIDVENPAINEIIARVPRGNAQDVERAVHAAKQAFTSWQHVSLDERVALMQRVVASLERNYDRLVDTVTAELGSPKKVSRSVHVDPFILEAKVFIENASKFQYEVQRPNSIVRFEPVGIVAGLTPWNFPLEQIEKKVVPALLAGNCVVLKPSQTTPLTAYILAEAIEEAGYPKGVFNLVTGAGGEVGDALASHMDVDMISFTGSTDAGREVARKGMCNIKRVALELGGKSAAVLLPGGDHALAVKAVLDTVWLNSGQTCNALTRLVVPRSELADVEAEIITQTANYKLGDPASEDADIGTMSSKKLYDRVRNYIKIGMEEGARVLLGELPPEQPGKGYYISPVAFTQVRRDMRIAQEEIFGPVLVVIPYDTEEEALDIANDSIYGLAGAVFGPADKAYAFAKDMRTGTVYVNDGEWDVYSPFGGYKQSGIGREGGLEGYEEFLEVKTVYTKQKL